MIGARGAARENALACVVLFVVAWVPRMLAVRAFAAEPVWDGHYYDFGARRIAAGLGYSDDLVVSGARVWHPWCHYPVGYSGFLAGVYRLFGESAHVANLANVAVGSLLAVATYLLAREALPRGRALLAGGIVALHPGLVLYGALVMSEPLAALLVLVSFVVTIHLAREGRGLLAMVAGGLVLGLGVLVRPQALLCAPFLALAIPGVRLRGRVVPAVIACIATLLPVAPWTARNCRVMDACALVSTNAGWNLAIGAFPRATGRFETLRSSDGCREVTGQVQQDRCWMSYGLASIREDPVRWLGLVPAKLSFTFDHESFPVEYLREARPTSWPEERRAGTRNALTAAHRVLVVLSPLAFVAFLVPRWRSRARGETRDAQRARIAQTATLGLVALVALVALSAATPVVWPVVLLACVLGVLPIPGRPPVDAALGLALVLLASTVVAHAVFFGEDRYHVVVVPVLALFAAAALRTPDTRAARSPLG